MLFFSRIFKNFILLCFSFCSFLAIPLLSAQKIPNSIINIYAKTESDYLTHIVVNFNYNPKAELCFLDKKSFSFTIKDLENKLDKDNIEYSEPLTLVRILNDESGEESVQKLVFSTTQEVNVKNICTKNITENIWSLEFDVVPVKLNANYYKHLNCQEAVQKLRQFNENKQKFVVVIDPGHGGIDSGAIAPDGTMEKNITLNFAKLLQKRLQENANLAVYLTRQTDKYLYLDERVALARELGANLFISIHADIINSRKIKGTTIYTLSQKGSDQIAKDLELSQNKVDEIGGNNFYSKNFVDDILIDLANKETSQYRSFIAQELVNSILKQHIKMINNPNRSANFRVLKAVDFPSVLIELGYLSNMQDKNIICNKYWQNRMASAIFNAIEKFRIYHNSNRNGGKL